jgi:hypothetical protein
MGHRPSVLDSVNRRAYGARNPKPEAGNPKEVRTPKSEKAKPQSWREALSGAEPGKPWNCRPIGSPKSEGFGGFGLRVSDFLRFSAFGLRIWSRDSAGNVEKSESEDIHSHLPPLLRAPDPFGRRELPPAESNGGWNNNVFSS